MIPHQSRFFLLSMALSFSAACGSSSERSSDTEPDGQVERAHGKIATAFCEQHFACVEETSGLRSWALVHDPWVQYEIQRARELKLGLLGVHIHSLANAKGAQSKRGPNPFEILSDAGARDVPVDVYDPPETDPKLVYRFIADHRPKWVEKAVATHA